MTSTGFPIGFASAVDSSEIEEGKASDQIGCVRSFYLKDGAHFRERLLSHSDAERSYTYNFEKTPFAVRNYHATIRVTPVTDGGRSFVEWWTTFDCDSEKYDHWVDFFANQIFQGGFEELKKRFAA